MKILITGANGMLGKELIRYLNNNPHYEVETTDRTSLDVTSEESIESYLNNKTFDFLINCAAYTNVNEAEDSGKEINRKVNGDAPGYLAKQCLKNKIRFLHISTDYVFGANKKEGYKEDDEPKSQINEYGRAKRDGEINALKENPDSIILRTTWIFGKDGKNYVDTMLNLAKDRDELSIVTDEVGTPTSTLDVCRQIEYLINSDADGGYYHAVCEGRCSRFEQSSKIFELAGVDIKLNETTLDKFERKAKVPNVSVLLNTKLPKLQSWEESIAEYLNVKI